MKQVSLHARSNRELRVAVAVRFMVVLGRKGPCVKSGWRCEGEGGRRGATPAQAEAGAGSGEGGTTGGFQQEEEGKEKVGLFMF